MKNIYRRILIWMGSMMAPNHNENAQSQTAAS
jgi:hypothetical protein